MTSNGMEVAVVEPVAVPTLFGTSDAKAIIADATNKAEALADVIGKQKLFSVIEGKKYVRVEGWTLLGTMLGVFPVCTWTRQIEDGWEARVEAHTLDGRVVGAAEAQCDRSEGNWKSRKDYALRSMAQTRATAKALRVPLGFVMSLAGFEATPAEERDDEETPAQPRQRQQAASRPSQGAQRGSSAISDFWKACREQGWDTPSVSAVSQSMFDGKEPADLTDDERQQVFNKLSEGAPSQGALT